jgi:hypothetical protein
MVAAIETNIDREYRGVSSSRRAGAGFGRGSVHPAGDPNAESTR